MKIIIPIAGRGSKFLSAGFTEPKALIPIKDKPMVKWATDSLPSLNFDANLIFIVLQEHINEFHIDKELKKYIVKKLV